DVRLIDVPRRVGQRPAGDGPAAVHGHLGAGLRFVDDVVPVAAGVLARQAERVGPLVVTGQQDYVDVGALVFHQLADPVPRLLERGEWPRQSPGATRASGGGSDVQGGGWGGYGRGDQPGG